MADPRAFLERWSRLKRRAAEEKPAAMPPATASPPASGSAAVSVKPEDDPVKDLPPVDSLDRDSDYRAFMRPGVPEELRNQALRKLWASDPVYANLDGLLEYGENFAEPFDKISTVATLYRVLEGMPQPEPAAEAPPLSQAPETQPATPAESCSVEEPAAGSKVGLDKVNVINSSASSDG